MSASKPDARSVLPDGQRAGVRRQTLDEAPPTVHTPTPVAS
jgi:hypothetical protein